MTQHFKNINFNETFSAIYDVQFVTAAYNKLWILIKL